MPTDLEAPAAAERRGPIRGPQSFVSGLLLIGIALFAIWAVSNLPQGTLRAMGPAMLPRWLAIGVGLCGLALVVGSLLAVGDRLERWSIRGPVFVLAGIFAFALTIRVFGTPEVRWKEIIIFAAVMTVFCVGLVRYALNLPIPIFIIPGVYQF